MHLPIVAILNTCKGLPAISMLSLIIEASMLTCSDDVCVTSVSVALNPVDDVLNAESTDSHRECVLVFKNELTSRACQRFAKCFAQGSPGVVYDPVKVVHLQLKEISLEDTCIFSKADLFE